MTKLRLNQPACGWAVNGLNANRAPMQTITSLGNGPYAWPVAPSPGIVRMGAQCRDIFLADIKQWSSNTAIRGLCCHKAQYAIVLTGIIDDSRGDARSARHEEIIAGRSKSLKALETSLKRYLGGHRISTSWADQSRDFDGEAHRAIAVLELVPQLWGNLLLASWLIATSRTWLQFGFDDPNLDLWQVFAEADKVAANTGDSYGDMGRWNRPNQTGLSLKQFHEIVREVGITGMPGVSQLGGGAYLNQSSWDTYIMSYVLGYRTDIRFEDTSAIRWSHISAASLGCTAVYNHLNSRLTSKGGSTIWGAIVDSLLHPAYPLWIQQDGTLNPKGAPKCLTESSEKPALSAAPEAQIAVETILQSTPTATAGATRAATAARRAAR